MNAFFSFYLSLCIYQWVNEERSRSGRKHLTAAELPRPLTASPNPAHGQRHREETEKTSPQRSRSSKRIKLSFSQTSNLPGRWAPCLSLEHPSSAAFHLQLQGATREATSLVFLFCFCYFKTDFQGNKNTNPPSQWAHVLCHHKSHTFHLAGVPRGSVTCPL